MIDILLNEIYFNYESLPEIIWDTSSSATIYTNSSMWRLARHLEHGVKTGIMPRFGYGNVSEYVLINSDKDLLQLLENLDLEWIEILFLERLHQMSPAENALSNFFSSTMYDKVQFYVPKSLNYLSDRNVAKLLTYLAKK